MKYKLIFKIIDIAILISVIVLSILKGAQIITCSWWAIWFLIAIQIGMLLEKIKDICFLTENLTQHPMHITQNVKAWQSYLKKG